MITNVATKATDVRFPRQLGGAMTRFFFPSSSALAEVGHGGLAGVPVLFGAGYKLLHAENRYLRERALGKWPDVDKVGRSRNEITPNTLKTIARRLHHFRDWCDLSDKRWRTIGYNHVKEYQNDQALGRGLFEGRAVSIGTANARADIATDFLKWARRRQLRGRFGVPTNTTTRLIDSGSRNFKYQVTTKSRAGM